MKRKFTDEEKWQWYKDNNAMFLYFNKEDTSIFVRKRYGISWTINLGNPWSYVILAGIAFVVMIQF